MNNHFFKSSSLICLSILTITCFGEEEQGPSSLNLIPAVREKSISIVKNLASRVQDLIVQVETLQQQMKAIEKMNLSTEMEALRSHMHDMDKKEDALASQELFDKFFVEMAEIKKQIALLENKESQSNTETVLSHVVTHLKDAEEQIAAIQVKFDALNMQDDLQRLDGQIHEIQEDLQLIAQKVQDAPTAHALKMLTVQVNNVQSELTDVKQDVQQSTSDRIAVADNATTRGRCGGFATAEWLYWQAYLGGMDYATTYKSWKYCKRGTNEELDFSFDSGFRVGLGYVFERDDWDIYGSYTQFYTHETDRLNGCSIFPLLVFEDACFGIHNVDSAKIHWSLHFNNADLDLGREYFAGDWLTFHPFAGVKAAWIDQKGYTKYYAGFCEDLPDSSCFGCSEDECSSLSSLSFFDNSSFSSSSSSCGGPCFSSSSSCSSSSFSSSSSSCPSCEGCFSSSSSSSCSCPPPSECPCYNVKWKNNFWGIGPKVGMGTNWFFIPNFSLYASAAGALLWGQFEVHQIQKNFAKTGISLKSDFNRLVPATQLRIGLLWDVFFNRNRDHLGLSLGWEMQYWWRQNQLARYTDVKKPVYMRTSDDLSLQGFTLGLRFDF